MNETTGGWIVGWTIGLAATALVVLLLVLLIRGASRAANKAEAIAHALRESQEHTTGLWEIDTLNRTVARITSAATGAREYLEQKAGQQ